MFDKYCCSTQLMLLFERYDFVPLIICNIDRIVNPIPNRLYEHTGNINMA